MAVPRGRARIERKLRDSRKRRHEYKLGVVVVVVVVVVLRDSGRGSVKADNYPATGCARLRYRPNP